MIFVGNPAWPNLALHIRRHKFVFSNGGRTFGEPDASRVHDEWKIGTSLDSSSVRAHLLLTARPSLALHGTLADIHRTQRLLEWILSMDPEPIAYSTLHKSGQYKLNSMFGR